MAARITGGQSGAIISVQEKNSFTRKIARAIRPKMEKALTLTAEEIARDARRELRQGAGEGDMYPNIATGRLLKSIKIGKFRYTEGGRQYSYSLPVYSDAPYARAFSRGRKPGSAPRLSALQDWAEQKFSANGFEQAAMIARKVRDKIRQKGTKARPFLRTAIDRQRQKFLGRIKRALKGGG